MLILYTYIYIQCICSNMHYVYIRNLSVVLGLGTLATTEAVCGLHETGRAATDGRSVDETGMLADLPCKRLHRCERSTICR